MSLRSLIAAELAEPVDPRVAAMAKAVAEAHGDASLAVIFYGSCLRERQLEGLMLDFYLIVDDYRRAYDKAWLAKANALIPPNVFHFQHEGLVAKYAVLDAADLARETSLDAGSVSVWARFAQPVRLVWQRDDKARQMVEAAVAEAPVTLFAMTLPLMDAAPEDSNAVWSEGFRQTYAAELRAERKGRGGSIIDSDPERYRQVGDAARREVETRGLSRGVSSRAMARKWKRLQRKGKALSVIRLAKASATFNGGAEYIAWKINRHAGTDIELTEFQKRHPLWAAVSLLPRLLRSGAIR
ncbi:hypothetical protein [Sphingomicrobium lutaoense]|uniref:Phosphatidate cytidylyltransferase n=1 Tax=Sphingomicrobium lutaoense TaxID=515949 RepID=A0A839YZD7_9SPHN|nr:hypothetical protein [Sphingomicrobium lutaoense]MBB3763127.1 hypothetical protein [Sphingomicrobium lutaoense]